MWNQNKKEEEEVLLHSQMKNMDNYWKGLPQMRKTRMDEKKKELLELMKLMMTHCCDKNVHFWDHASVMMLLMMVFVVFCFYHLDQKKVILMVW